MKGNNNMKLNLICPCCGYNEEHEEKGFIGIFAPGTTLSTTDRETCAMYGCPKCHTVQFVTDSEYIQQKKDEYRKNR